MVITWSHRHEEVEDGPSKDDDVVHVHPAGHHSGRVANTWNKVIWDRFRDNRTIKLNIRKNVLIWRIQILDLVFQELNFTRNVINVIIDINSAFSI